MKKYLSVIIITVISLILIVSGTILYYSIHPNNEKNNNIDVKEEYIENATNTKIKSTYKYKNLNINDILFKVQEDQCLLEMTLVNIGTENFTENETKIIFYDKKNKIIGNEKVYLPMVGVGKSEYIMLEIKDKSLFKAYSLSFEELKQEKKEEVKEEKPMQTG